MATISTKRRRISGSFSPTSPPYHTTFNYADTTRTDSVQPQPQILKASLRRSPSPGLLGHENQSPPPPPLPPHHPSSFVSSSMSPRFDSQGTTLNCSGPTFRCVSTPPSPLCASQNSTSTLAPPQQTNKRPFVDDEGDTQMLEAQTVTHLADVSEASTHSRAEQIRTDHDREHEDSAAEVSAAAEKPQVRHETLFKICEYPYSICHPHPSADLMSLYHLNSIASSVARKDPATGEKINKLRKSYERQTKNLRLAGKNKAISSPGEFTNLLLFPDEEWQNQKVLGKETSNALTPTLQAKLERALRIAPGPLPVVERDKWKSVLGLDEPPKAKAASDAGAKKSSQDLNPHINLIEKAAMWNSLPSSHAKSHRPERAGKKRSYQDNSFKGYGEGYVDDEPVGSSTGEDELRAGSMKAKRRRLSVGQVRMSDLRTAAHTAVA